MDRVELAIKMSKLVHDKCKDVPHDIGLQLLYLIEEYDGAFRQCNVSGRSEQLKGEYTEHFIEWRDKYFDYNPVLVEWKTKKRNERYTTKQILSRYKRAMLKSPFNCH